MLTLDIYDNYNGKLFCDVFTEIFQSPSSHKVGDELELRHRGILMGRVTVVAKKKIHPFHERSDVEAYINFGSNPQKQALLLTKKYGGGSRFERDAPFTLVVFAYVSRDMENQIQISKEWWQNKIENTAA